MKTNLPGMQAVLLWLLAFSPSTRWQVCRQTTSLWLLILSLLVSSTYEARSQNTATTVTCEADFTYIIEYPTKATSFTQTFTPATPGRKLVVSFAGLSISAGDTLFIYDGATTQAPILKAYTHTGGDIYNQLVNTTTNAGGQLTFQLVATPTSVSSWQATVATIRLPFIELPKVMAGSALSVNLAASPAGNYRYSVDYANGDTFSEGNYSLDSTTGELKIFRAKAALEFEEGGIGIRATDANGCFAQGNYYLIAQCPQIQLPAIPQFYAEETYQASLAVVNPPGNYTYSILTNRSDGSPSGLPPSGVTFDSLTATLSGVPAYANDEGFFTIQALSEGMCKVEKTYYYSTRPYKYNNVPFPDSLAKGEVGQTYYATVNPGSRYGYYFMDAPSGLPPGLDFEYETGSIIGIPTTAGIYQFQVQASNFSGYESKSLNYTIVIEEGTSTCPTIIFPDSIPHAIVNQAYTASVAVSSAGEYTYSLLQEGDFPISIDPQTGRISTFSDHTLELSFVVRATAANGCYADRPYELYFACPKVSIITPKKGIVGEPYSIYVTNDQHYALTIYETAQQKFPEGLRGSENGYIYGIPTKAGTYTLNYHANDFQGCYFGGTFTLTIDPATCTASGSILRETWVKVKSYRVDYIPTDLPPTATRQLTRFEGPSNVTNEYGDRIRGYICPPISGNYTFWIASDDNSALYLSSDNQISNKQRIAWVNGVTKPGEWTKFASQQSAPIYLEAGQKYYIESLHKEAYGDDHIAVGWQLPSGTLERPIPGKRLSPFVAPANARTTYSEEEVELQLASIASLSAAPNPFWEQTTIRFSAQVAGKATVAVYDLNGSLVKVLLDGELEAGETKELTLEGAALPSGVYLVKATSQAGVSVLKLVLTK